MGGTIFKAAPSVRYVPSRQIAWHEIENELSPSASYRQSLFQATGFGFLSPPGLSVLRI
jgi:hypothetical protein